MNNEGLTRTSNVVDDPTQETETPLRVNVDVLKQRLIEQKRKDRVKANNYFIYSGGIFRRFDNVNLLKLPNPF